MPKRIPVLLATLLTIPSQSSKRPEGLPSAAEFPSQDRGIWSLVSDDITRTLAATRLAEAPDSPETVRLLAAAKNLTGLLAALRRIVDTQPRRIADAFDATGQSLWELRGDSAQTLAHAATLRGLVEDARRRLSDVPRELWPCFPTRGLREGHEQLSGDTIAPRLVRWGRGRPARRAHRPLTCVIIASVPRTRRRLAAPARTCSRAPCST